MRNLTSTAQTSTFTDYYKVIFLGKQGTGKTSIIQRLVTSKSDIEPQPTLGINYHNVELEYQNKKYYFQFWDISNAQEILGYAPEDNAEEYAQDILKN